MDFDLQWLLLGLPLAFGIGWLASRLDLRQGRRERRDSPRAYFKGLNLLLNEQHDKAIDSFIEAVQQDPDTSELHFALGNLFRRRGEYERAVRVHEHLMSRADLPRADRDRAQHALAQDFLKAGIFDRAEAAWRALEGTAFDTEARLALLSLHERSRNWRAAVDVAHKLERSGTGSYSSRIAHYWCELAIEADAHQATGEANEALNHARAAAPLAARPLLLSGQRARLRNDHVAALHDWGSLMVSHPAVFCLVATEFAESARALGQSDSALTSLVKLSKLESGLQLLRAIALLDTDVERRRTRLREHLQRHPSLSGARALLQLEAPPPDDCGDRGLIDQALAQSAQPLQRYRCAACGFEAQHYFWQCPGCLSWDSYPPKMLEDLG